MSPKNSKWPEREPIVLMCAGILPGPVIAEIIGVSYSRLRHLCARKKVSLKVEGLRSQRMKGDHPHKRNPPTSRRRSTPVRVNVNSIWKSTSTGCAQ